MTKNPTINKFLAKKIPSKKMRGMRTAVLLIFFMSFFILTLELPEFGREIGEVSQHYLEYTLPDTGALSVVGAIVWSYRGYDTFGEVTVLLTAVTAIFILLKEEI